MGIRAWISSLTRGEWGEIGEYARRSIRTPIGPGILISARRQTAVAIESISLAPLVAVDGAGQTSDATVGNSVFFGTTGRRYSTIRVHSIG